MPRRKRHVPLQVFLNSHLVGRLVREPSGTIDFRYDPAWLDWEHARPVSLSRLCAKTGISARRSQPSLRTCSRRAMPCVAVSPRECMPTAPIPIASSASSAATASAPCNSCPMTRNPARPARSRESRSTTPRSRGCSAIWLRHRSDAARTRIFGFSLAGAQEKTALLRSNGQWFKPTGTTATTHILKPQIGRLPNGIDMSCSVENEFFCLRLTAALGLPSAAVEIATFVDKRVLVVERFDRRWTRDGRLLRLPQEDGCQALSVPSGRKYETDGGPGIRSILNLLGGSDDPEADRRAVLAALMIFWLLGATDGHAKNFSVFLAPGGRFRLTPLYDVVSAQPSADAGQIRRAQMKLAMAVGDNRHYVIDTIRHATLCKPRRRPGSALRSCKVFSSPWLREPPRRSTKSWAACRRIFQPRSRTPSSRDFAIGCARSRTRDDELHRDKRSHRVRLYGSRECFLGRGGYAVAGGRERTRTVG